MSGKCQDCEFCFPNEEFGFVCAGDNYGEDISKSLDEIKECYSEGLHAFIARCEKEEAVLAPGTTLSQLKLDGRKRIEITDQEGKMINIKASKAKELFPEMEVERALFEDAFVVKAIFNKEPFNGGKYLMIK